MRNEQGGMNNDPSAAGREGSHSGSGRSHSRHSGHFWIQLQRFLLVQLECGGGFEEGVSEWMMNAGGMRQECQTGGFLEAACSMRADVAPGEFTGSSFRHCLPFSSRHAHLTEIHTQIPLEYSPL